MLVQELMPVTCEAVLSLRRQADKHTRNIFVVPTFMMLACVLSKRKF